MENLEYWYNYGFSGIIDDAAAMERAAGIEYITREVATFAKCDPNFKGSELAGNPAFIFNFSLYLAGRADERRAVLTGCSQQSRAEPRANSEKSTHF